MSKKLRTIQLDACGPMGGRVDRANGIIHGVSVLTAGIEAIGHDLHVDDLSTSQMLACGRSKDQVPVKLDHGSGIKNVCGYLSEFRMDGAQLRADWHLLKTHEEFEATMERAERMPKCFGMSPAFKGKDEVVGGKKFARCTELLAVDCVAMPAANPDGLLEAAVDTHGNRMAENTTTEEQEPTLRDVMAAFNNFQQSVNERMDRNEAMLADMQSGGEELQLADLANMSDEQLDQGGWDVGAVRAAVESAVQSGELTIGDPGQGGEGEGEGGEGEGEGAGGIGGEGAGVAAGSGAAAGTAFERLQSRVNGLIRTLEAKERYALEASERHELEEAFVTLHEKVDELTQLCASQASENDALRVAVRTGVQHLPVGAAADHLFSAKNDPEATEFEQLTSEAFEAMVAQKIPVVNARARAVTQIIHSHPEAFREFRASGRVITLGK